VLVWRLLAAGDFLPVAGCFLEVARYCVVAVLRADENIFRLKFSFSGFSNNLVVFFTLALSVSEFVSLHVKRI